MSALSRSGSGCGSEEQRGESSRGYDDGSTNISGYDDDELKESCVDTDGLHVKKLKAQKGEERTMTKALSLPHSLPRGMCTCVHGMQWYGMGMNEIERANAR